VALTDAGWHFLPHARDAMGALDNGLVELATFERRLGGGIRIAVSPALATSLVPDVVARFGEQTGTGCEIVDTELDNFGALLDGDQVDAAYTNSPITSRTQRVEPLFSAHTVLAVPAGWQLGAGVHEIAVEADWAPFRQARRFVLPARNAFQRSVDRMLLQARAPEMPQQELQHLATILAFVEAGLGLGFAPRFMLGRHAGIRAIALPASLSAVAFFCLTRGDRPVPPQVRRFSALLAAAGEA
jgi:DNA-binding transcriptional LysR family regulator